MTFSNDAVDTTNCGIIQKDRTKETFTIKDEISKISLFSRNTSITFLIWYGNMVRYKEIIVSILRLLTTWELLVESRHIDQPDALSYRNTTLAVCHLMQVVIHLACFLFFVCKVRYMPLQLLVIKEIKSSKTPDSTRQWNRGEENENTRWIRHV